ncbi:MAG: hypothetical protein P4L84_33850 [Isosphaeraceae bacterium]|nr:hypothetical protein [Isosphaeraceae bacterium]
MNRTGDNFIRALRRNVTSNVDDAGAHLQDAIEQAISTPGPRQSAAGDAPHVDTGQHHSSWSHETDATDPDVIASRVSTDTPYALDLEIRHREHGPPGPRTQATVIDEANQLGREICQPWRFRQRAGRCAKGREATRGLTPAAEGWAVPRQGLVSSGVTPDQLRRNEGKGGVRSAHSQR